MKHDAFVKTFLDKRRKTLDMLRGEIGAQADDDVAGRQRKREGFGHIGTPDRRVGRSHSGARLPRPRSKCRKGSSLRFHLGETGTRGRLGRRKRPGRTARWTNAKIPCPPTMRRSPTTATPLPSQPNSTRLTG